MYKKYPEIGSYGHTCVCRLMCVSIMFLLIMTISDLIKHGFVMEAGK